MLLVQFSDSSKLVTPSRTMKLFVWFDVDEQDVKYSYGAGNSVDFGGQAGQKTLHVELHSIDTVSPTDPSPRFELAFFTANKLKNIQSVTPHTNAGPQPPQLPKISGLPSGSKRASFDLQMNNKDSFYLDIIVKDKANGDRLICCDPQVENGTKT